MLSESCLELGDDSLLAYIKQVSPFFEAMLQQQLQDFANAVNQLSEIGDKRQSIQAFKAVFLQLLEERSKAGETFFAKLTDEQECGTLVDMIGSEALRSVINEELGSTLNNAEDDERTPETSGSDDTTAANAPECTGNESHSELDRSSDGQTDGQTDESIETSEMNQSANEQLDESQTGDQSTGHAE